MRLLSRLLHMTASLLARRRRVQCLLLVCYRPLATLSRAPALLSVTESTRELQLYVRSLCTTVAPFCIVTRCALPLGHSESKLSQVLKC